MISAVKQYAAVSDLKPYAEYKESAIPWLGPIPVHWSQERAKNLLTKMDRPVRDGDEIVTCFRDGVVTLRKNRRLTGFTEAIYEFGYQGIRKGDLVIHAMDAFAGAIGVSDSDGKATPVYAVCQPKSGVNAYYYAFIVREMARTQWILALSRGIRERSTDFRYNTFGEQTVPLPPPDEQTKIVRFLDWANGRLDKAIRAKQKIITLLNEQKQSIIHDVVTRGLDPTSPLKPSGVEWLPEIPIKWKVCRLKTLLVRIDQGVSPQAEARLADDGAWGVLKSGCVNHGVFRETEHKRLPDDFLFDEELAIHKGDVLVSRACGSPRLVGSVGRVSDINYRLILSDKTFRLVFRTPQLVDFAVAAMNSRYFRLQVEQAISGAEGLANNLPLTSLKNFLLIVPPVEIAQEIGCDLEAKLGSLMKMVETTRREIELLREYRSRLVADVVTGKLDVREAAALLPEEVSTEVNEDNTDLSLIDPEATDEESVV